jgi:uncharacterized membrane protein
MKDKEAAERATTALRYLMYAGGVAMFVLAPTLADEPC